MRRGNHAQVSANARAARQALPLLRSRMVARSTGASEACSYIDNDKRVKSRRAELLHYYHFECGCLRSAKLKSCRAPHASWARPLPGGNAPISGSRCVCCGVTVLMGAAPWLCSRPQGHRFAIGSFRCPIRCDSVPCQRQPVLPTLGSCRTESEQLAWADSASAENAVLAAATQLQQSCLGA